MLGPHHPFGTILVSSHSPAPFSPAKVYEPTFSVKDSRIFHKKASRIHQASCSLKTHQ
jgi:hypothetical protein